MCFRVSDVAIKTIILTLSNCAGFSREQPKGIPITVTAGSSFIHISVNSRFGVVCDWKIVLSLAYYCPIISKGFSKMCYFLFFFTSAGSLCFHPSVNSRFGVVREK